MSFIGNAIGKTVGGITGARQQGKAAEAAAGAQIAAAESGIAEQRVAREEMQRLLQPYVDAGTGALGAQRNLIGLSGQPAQREAIEALSASPEFQALLQQGENAMLQNASATGGLRGGNLQGALAQFRPAMLAQLIAQQYERLGGLTGIGQASAAGVGAAGQQTGAAIADLLAQQGAARAGGQIARGSTARAAFGDLLQIGSVLAGKGAGGPPVSVAPAPTIGSTNVGANYSFGGGSGLGLKMPTF